MQYRCTTSLWSGKTRTLSKSKMLTLPKPPSAASICSATVCFSGLGMYAAIATPQDTVPLSAGVQGHRSDSLVSIGESESCYGATRTGGKKRCGNGKGQRGEPERPRRRRLQRRHGGRHARRGARGGERSAEGAQSGACKRAPRRKATIGVSIRNTIGRPVLAQCMKRRERTGAEEADGRGCI